MMMTQNGTYVCSLCGTEFKIKSDEQPVTLIKASSGETNQRVIMLGDKELHSCALDPDAK